MAIYSQKSELDDIILALVQGGTYLKALKAGLAVYGYSLSKNESARVQRELWEIASSLRRSSVEKANTLERFVSDFISTVGKVAEIARYKNDENEKREGTPRLSQKNEYDLNPGKGRFLRTRKKSPEKTPLNDSDLWTIRGINGRPLARIEDEGFRLVAFSFRGERIGTYNKATNITFDRNMRPVSYGNTLSSLVKP